jgi:hypothetical protein
MLPTPKPVAVLRGLMNKPMVWRVPIVNASVPAAASNTSQTAQTRAGDVLFDMVNPDKG